MPTEGSRVSVGAQQRAFTDSGAEGTGRPIRFQLRLAGRASLSR